MAHGRSLRSIAHLRHDQRRRGDHCVPLRGLDHDLRRRATALRPLAFPAALVGRCSAIARLDLPPNACVLGRRQNAWRGDQQPREPLLSVEPLLARALGRLHGRVGVSDRRIDGDAAGVIEDVLSVVSADRRPAIEQILPIIRTILGQRLHDIRRPRVRVIDDF